MTGTMILWLIILVASIIIEAATLQLVSIWFAVGSVVALILAKLGVPLGMQALVCLLVSGILMAFTRPLLKKIMPKRVARTNADGNVGRTALIIEKVDALAATGRARLDGVDWQAVSEDGSVIEEGVSVTVTAVNSTKLTVVPEKILTAKE